MDQVRWLDAENIKSRLQDETRYDAVEAALPPDDSGYPMPRDLIRFIARLVVMEGRRSVLEFGAGQSSLALARAMQLVGGGRLTSVDHMPRYCIDAWRHVERVPSVDAQLVISRLRPRLGATGLLSRYVDAWPAVGSRAPYDLVVVDAPPNPHRRDATVHLALPYLRQGAVTVLDDAARVGERDTVHRWLGFYPGLKLLLLEPTFARGVAVLQFDGRRRRRMRLRPFVGSLLYEWARSKRRHRPDH